MKQTIFELLLTSPYWLGGYIVIRAIEFAVTWLIRNVKIGMKDE